MRILVVEDEQKVARFIAKGLQAEGFAVDTAPDGETALYQIREIPYDLIVLDLGLPGMIDGTRVLRDLRAGSQGKMPVLVLTARDGLTDKVTHFEAGADDYLTKPFAFSELVVRVKALLRRGPAYRSDLLRVADLEIDRLTRVVQRGGTEIKLTAKEYGLLDYLASHAGRVLSRTMIIEHVWDDSFEGMTNIVDVYVRQLRSKIDDPFEKKLIRTVRSVGYSLEDRPES